MEGNAQTLEEVATRGGVGVGSGPLPEEAGQVTDGLNGFGSPTP